MKTEYKGYLIEINTRCSYRIFDENKSLIVAYNVPFIENKDLLLLDAKQTIDAIAD